MNYTEKYHLPQWEESDRVMRTDFNSAMAALENGLSGNAQGINEAKTAAAEAAKLPYVVGRYVGWGPENPQTIKVGFMPSFVLIFSTQLGKDAFDAVRVAAAGRFVGSQRVTMLEDGFQVEMDHTNSFPDVNYYQREYEYIAFR